MENAPGSPEQHMDDSSYDDETNSYDEEDDDIDCMHEEDPYKASGILSGDLALNKIQHLDSSNPQQFLLKQQILNSHLYKRGPTKY